MKENAENYFFFYFLVMTSFHYLWAEHLFWVWVVFSICSSCASKSLQNPRNKGILWVFRLFLAITFSCLMCVLLLNSSWAAKYAVFDGNFCNYDKKSGWVFPRRHTFMKVKRFCVCTVRMQVYGLLYGPNINTLVHSLDSSLCNALHMALMQPEKGVWFRKHHLRIVYCDAELHSKCIYSCF